MFARCRWLLLVGVVVTCPIESLSAGDRWSAFQNGGKTAVAAANAPVTWNDAEDLAWSATLDGYGQSTPVVWDGQVYATSCSGENKERLYLRALDLNSGKTRWRKEFENSTPEANSNYISKAAPTPVVDAAGVIALFEGGNLVAFDHQGKLRWQRDLPQQYGAITSRHGLSASLEQAAEQVFVWIERAEEPYVLAVNKADGRTVWKSPGIGKTSWASPRLAPVGDGQHLVLSGIGAVVGLDPATGKRLWQFDQVSNNSTPTPMPVGNGRFLLGATVGRGGESSGATFKSNGLMQITKENNGAYQAEYVWRADKATSSFGSPIAAGGNAYFVARGGVLYCLDLATGKQHYVQRTTGSVWATPISVGERIYLFARDGTTTVIDAGKEFKILAENTLPAATAQDAAADDAPQSAELTSGSVLYAGVIVDGAVLLRYGNRIDCVRP